MFRLDGQSFWSDEGASVFMTGRSFGQILEAAAGDIHPPLYYLFLRYWSVPVGTSEFAVRFLSVAFGVLLVVLIYKLGERLANRDAGLIGAFIAAASPFLIYYSQEARMYAQMATFSALSVLLALRIWGIGDRGRGMGDGAPTLDPRPSTLIPYVLATAAALYSQYFAFTIVLFENFAFALLFWRFWRNWRRWATWIAMQLAIALLFLPWLLRVLGQLSAWPAVSESFSLQTLVYRVFLVFSFGLSWDMTTTAKTQALFAALALAGAIACLVLVVRSRGGFSPSSLTLLRTQMIPSLRREGITVSPRPPQRERARVRASSVLMDYSARSAILFLFFAVPVGVMYYLSLSRPMYNPKFLLLATPPYYILLGMGIGGIKDLIAAAGRHFVKRAPLLSSLASVAAVGIVLLSLAGTTFATSRSLAAYYFDPKYGRDDYRGLARYIELSGRPGDAIVLNAPGQVEIFGYYYKGQLPVLPLPKQRPIDEKATETDLKEAAAQYRRIWVVFWAEKESDPGGFVESWLNQNTFRASNKWYGSVRLVLYSVPTSTEAGTIQRQVDANLGNQVTLLGYSLARAIHELPNQASSGADYDAKPGEVLQLTLFWKALAKIEARYTVFTHLLDSHEHIWGQRDAEPGSGAKPTTSWSPGSVISDNYGIPIVAGTPPGDYFVEVGLYQAATGQRLQLLNDGGSVVGDRVLFGPLRVGKADSPPAIDSLGVEHPLTVDFGPLRLVGYEFYKLGFERGNLDFQRSDLARLAFYWQAREKPGKDYGVVVQLLDQDGKVVFTKQNGPADGSYPTGQWDKGEVVLDQHKLLLDLPPGRYRLVLGINDGKVTVKPQGSGSKAQGDFVELQTLEVK